MCLYRDIATEPVTQFFAWVTLPVMLVLFAAGFVHVVAPQSAGKTEVDTYFNDTYLIILFFLQLRIWHTGNENHPSGGTIEGVPYF